MATGKQFQFARLRWVVLSIVFIVLTRLWRAFRHLVGKGNDGTCVVLLYHSVEPEHRARFARQMDILLRWAMPTRADSTEPLPPNRHHVAVTFDDGYVTVIANALPELEKRMIPATIFVVVGALGRNAHWFTNPSHRLKHEVMSADQLRKLPPDLITVGSHTVTHRRLTTLSPEEAKQELSESRTKLETMLNKDVKLFAFPYGAFSEQLVTWCRVAGYDRVFTSSLRLAWSGLKEFETGRVAVDPTDGPLEFRLKLMGGYGWIPLAVALRNKVFSLARWKGASIP